MFKNHLKIAWRSLKKQPFFTFLNTFGLAIGMAGGLLICLYIYDELSFDKMFADADRIYRINVDVKFGGNAEEYSEVSAPMAQAMKRDYPQIEVATRFRNLGSMFVRKSDAELNVKEVGITYVDTTFFEMFGLDLLVGNPKTALKEPNTLILTKTAAEKHFGISEALGQNMILDNRDIYTVVGVIDDMPENSFIRNHNIFIAMAGNEDSFSTEWGNHNYPTFIKLRSGSDIKDFDTFLKSALGTYVIPGVQNYAPGITEEQFLASGNYLNFSTIALTDIHLYSNRYPELSVNSDVQNVYILSFIALFLIILASVNFMNLSTAHSLKRAKEVGVRKTLGSNKSELIRQFLIESGLISFISLVLAIIVASVALPFFNELAGKEISIPFTNPFFWLILLASVMLLSLFSGSYPAFFMSKFKPIQAMKGIAENNIGGGKIRNSLVVFQFAISIFLIVSTLVVFQQLKFIQNKDLGFTKDQVLIIDDVYVTENEIASFKEEVQQLSQVRSTSISGFLPTPSFRGNSTFYREGLKDDHEKAINMNDWDVDFDYVSTLNLEIIAGRDFNRQFSTDSTAMILNESAVTILGVTPEKALGMRLSSDYGEDEVVFRTVIGVVKDFHYESLRRDIDALGLSLNNSFGSMAVKLNAGDFSNTIAQIETIWNRISPGQPFNYYFMDESFNTTYRAEQRLGRIFIIFTILSILIACLGLFGLAAFNAEKRTKEIGVRKVLGASVSHITYKLTIDFLKLVGIAILISLPLGWFAMRKWLEDFSYRIEISWWVFVIAAFLAVCISILTVSYQSIKAAIVNPVKSLRTE
ncbi:FtsX-like permease family protein [Aquimarina algiphila]|uniref:FtsX-like permease family protein n=1 Tax=Aquimarina algiphila TaxID=2047982 RepID=A0A554VKX3_9FLAO|nr:FtsX-like permease family protein [Aquimarina algiphila]TSE08713.1 FtsX-like permease family protein [Aquimarina algiphila]